MQVDNGNSELFRTLCHFRRATKTQHALPHWPHPRRYKQCKKTDTADNFLNKDRKRKTINEQPTHKTAHLQTAQADKQTEVCNRAVFLPTQPMKMITLINKINNNIE